MDIQLYEVDISNIAPNSTCAVHLMHVQIKDIKERAEEMINTILSRSWINDLPSAIDRVSYEARANRTIEKLANDVFKKISTPISDEFGEYVVSMSAQDSLEIQMHHQKVPLAELFKEKISGNPGFDFHTESQTNFIAFGEAKYSANDNPYTRALSQIIEFIGLRKDIMELTDLRNFVSGTAIDNAMSGQKAYVAAFSINSLNRDLVYKNVLKSEYLKGLLEYPEVYLIGVEIVD